MRREAIKVFDEAKASALPYELHVRRFHEYFESNRDLRAAVLDFMVALAFADGELSAEEAILISQTSAIFGIEHEQYEAYRKRRRAAEAGRSDRSRAAYHADVLGLGGVKDFGIDDVKQAYRELAVQYRPDKVAHLGPRLRQVAEEEMKKINEAYAFFTQRHQSGYAQVSRP